MRRRKLLFVAAGVVLAGVFGVAFAPPGFYAQLGEGFTKLAINRYQSADTASARMGLARLYLSRGGYEKAYELLKELSNGNAQRLAAIGLFKLGRWTEAISLFERLGEDGDNEYLYYYAATCERHNLYDQAERLYRKITAGPFLPRAKQRLKSLSHLVRPRADKDILRIMDQAPSAEDYPDAGALFLSVEEKTEVLPDNTTVSSIHNIIKILNDRGKEEFSEVLLGYDSTYERVELEFARTIKPDGTAVSVGDKNIRDVSRYLNFPLYSNARVKIVSMPEVAPGALLEYKARIYSNRMIADRHFSLSYSLQESQPVIHSRFDLIVPRERKVNIKILNPQYNKFGAELKPQVNKAGDKLVYSLKVKDIPQIIPEPDMPPRSEINSLVLFSSFSSWQEMFDWWSGLYKDKIKPDEAIKQKTDELTKDLNSQRDKARAIYHFCARRIRYVAIEYGRAGYEPHRASEVFLNKYGDCKDQAMLLITMLRYAGLRAYPVLIGTRGSVALSEDFPASYFNHAIAAVDIDGEIVFIDPTADTVSFGDLPAPDQARKVMVFFEHGYKIMDTPDFGPKHNFIHFDTRITLGRDEKISAERSLRSGGIYEQMRRYWLIYTPPTLIEEGIKNKVQEFSPNGRLLDYTIENARDLTQPVVFDYKFEGDDYLVHAGEARVLPLPVGGVDISSLVKEERKYPLYFGNLSQTVDKIKLFLPAGIRIKYLPQALDIDNQWMSYSLGCGIKGRVLECRAQYQPKKKYIPPSEYREYKGIVEGLARRLNQAIILDWDKE
ncbi:MAG: DUF3857 domain-containing protein [Candidatus Omnitrophota bacterium]